MGSQIGHRRRTSQPQQVVPIDHGNPLTQNLVLCVYVVGNTFYDAVSGQSVPHPGTMKVRTPGNENKQQAITTVGTAAAGGKFTNPTGMDKIAGVHSVFVEGSLEVNASTQALLRSFESGAGHGFGITFDDVALINNGFFYWRENGNGTTSTSGALGANSELTAHRVMFTNDGTNSNFYAVGVLNRTVANATLPVANTNRRTTVLGSNGTQGSGSGGIWLVWDRVLSLGEYEALYDNPWQVLSGPAQTYFAVSSGIQSLTVTPTGGIVFAGTGTAIRQKFAVPTGGIALSGTAASSRGIVRSPSGGITFSGAATQTRGRTVVPVGGITLSGAATVIRGMINSATGGIVFAGTAPVTFFHAVQSLVVTPVGGIVFRGSATVIRTIIKAASGGIIFGGSAPYSSGPAGQIANWLLKARRRNNR